MVTVIFLCQKRSQARRRRSRRSRKRGDRREVGAAVPAKRRSGGSDNPAIPGAETDAGLLYKESRRARVEGRDSTSEGCDCLGHFGLVHQTFGRAERS